MSFAEFGLAQPILRAVAAEGYTIPTPIQSQTIPLAVAGRDLLGCAQTGTGKTAAFALPILQRLLGGEPSRTGRGRPIRALILSPTRELAAQIGDSFRAYGRHAGLRHTVVFGGVNQGPQVRDLQHGVDILVATPGRLLDLMNQRFIDLSAVQILVLDEADRMLDMGFLPDLRRIIAKVPRARQTLLFSATMPPEIAQLAGSILRDPVEVRVAPDRATTEQIEHAVCFVTREQKPQLLANFLNGPSVTRALVFTRTKRGADRVTRQLNRAGISAAAIHGDKTQSARQRALEGFKSNRNGRQVLVATDVAARGIDVDGVSHVLNYDLPLEPEIYVHRIGRTGRAGAAGIAVSFCDRDERQHLLAIERLLRRKLPVDSKSSLDLPAVPAGKPPAGSPRAGKNRQPPTDQNRSHGRSSEAKQLGGKRRRTSAKPRKTHPSPQRRTTGNLHIG
jgi:ATP-dependent RNA helicase RhlE